MKSVCLVHRAYRPALPRAGGRQESGREIREKSGGRREPYLLRLELVRSREPVVCQGAQVHYVICFTSAVGARHFGYSSACSTPVATQVQAFR